MPKKVSDFQKSEIARLTRLANRRIERAGEGQKAALQYWVKQMTGSEKFSAATKGLSFQQAQAKLRDLYKFVDYKGSTKGGWKKLKKLSVESANEKLDKMGYDLTDQELADILMQLNKGASRADFYRAVNQVQAAKEEAGSEWDATAEKIGDIIAEKVSYQEAYEKANEAKEKRAARRASRK